MAPNPTAARASEQASWNATVVSYELRNRTRTHCPLRSAEVQRNLHTIDNPGFLLLTATILTAYLQPRVTMSRRTTLGPTVEVDAIEYDEGKSTSGSTLHYRVWQTVVSLPAMSWSRVPRQKILGCAEMLCERHRRFIQGEEQNENPLSFAAGRSAKESPHYR